MLGARVGKARAEELRRALSSSGLIDRSFAIAEDHDHVIFPLSSRPSESFLRVNGAGLVESEFSARKPKPDPPRDVRRVARVPEELKELLPDKWELFGEVLVLRLDSRLDRYESEVAQVFSEVLGARTVLRDVGGISGEYRKPVVRKLLGEDTVAVHRENGITFKFDAYEVMFSSGNMEERIRMADIACTGETVVDMFAGIGYFSLPLAVYQGPKRIIACEINPVAHRYLKENIALNSVEDKVEAVLGDNRYLPGSDFADRVIMGYVKTTHEFLPKAIEMLRSGGVIHYHETCPNDLLPARPVQRIVDGARGARVEVIRQKEVKSYAPGVSHVVVDARIFKPS